MGRASHDSVPACLTFPVGPQAHVALSSQGRHLSPRPGADPQKGKSGLLIATYLFLFMYMVKVAPFMINLSGVVKT